MYTSYKLVFNSVLPCEKGTPAWGFCDGHDVFIAKSDRFKKKNKYDKVIYMGRYVYYKSTSTGANGSPMWMMAPGSGTGMVLMGGGGGGKRLFEYGIDINTGNGFVLTKDEIRNILSKDDVLLREFEQEKKKRHVLGQYLIKYSEKHIEQIEKL